MNKKEFKSLIRVINYLKEDEQKHFEEGNFNNNHIWNDVKVLMDYAQVHQFTLQNAEESN